jgi:hypothetical protein
MTGLKVDFTLSVHCGFAQAFQGQSLRHGSNFSEPLPAKNFSTSPLQVRHFHVSIDFKKRLILRTEYLGS